MTSEEFALVVYALAYHCDQYASVQGGFNGDKKVNCPEVEGARLQISVSAVEVGARVFVTLVRMDSDNKKTICSKKAVDLETLLLVLIFGKLSGSPKERGKAQMHIASFRAQHIDSQKRHQVA